MADAAASSTSAEGTEPNEAVTETTGRSTGTTISIALTVAVIVAASLGTAGVWCDRWLEEDSVGAGFVLVAAAVWAAYRNRAKLVRAASPQVLGIVLIYVGFAGKLASELLAMRIPDRLGLYVQIIGLVLLWCGFSGVVAWWRPLLLLLAAIPLPVSVQGRIYPQLGEFALVVIGPLVEIAGATVLPGEGGTFAAFDGIQELQLEVVQMPFYFAALALVVGCVRGRGLLGLVLLVVCALPILVACNGARSVIAVLGGVDVATAGIAPVVLNWGMLPVALGPLLLIDRLALGRDRSSTS